MDLLIITVLFVIAMGFSIRKFQPDRWAKIKQFLKF